jgi:hypothetical protein
VRVWGGADSSGFLCGGFLGSGLFGIGLFISSRLLGSGLLGSTRSARLHTALENYRFVEEVQSQQHAERN